MVVRGIVVSDLIFFFFLFSPSEEGFDQIGWARSLPVVIFGGWGWGAGGMMIASLFIRENKRGGGGWGFRKAKGVHGMGWDGV